MAHDPTYDRERLFDYLLGRLSEADQEALETCLFADDSVFAAVETAENDLVDLYVLGQLSGADRARMESHYLAVGDLAAKRRKVEFARRLRTVVDASREPWWKAFFAPLSMPRLAFASMAVALLAMGWFSFTLLREQQAAREDLARLRVVQPPPQPLQNPAEVQLIAKSIPLPVLELNPLLERSASTVARLRIGASSAARIRMRLDATPSDFTSFAATLETPDGAVKWNSAGLKASANTVEAIIPAASLKAGEYILRLSGKTRAGQQESLADYSLQITR